LIVIDSENKEDKRQRSEVGGRKDERRETGDRGQRAEDRGQRSEYRRQGTGDRR